MGSKKSLYSLTRKAGYAALATALAATVSGSAFASSHREAPNITGNPRLDGTDFYMFQSYETGRAGYTTLIANYYPGQNPFDGPNYYALDPNAIYEIHIDNTGGAKENLTFQFQFQQALPNGTGDALTVGGKSVAVPLKNVGTISAGNNANLNFAESYTVTMITGDRRTGFRAPLVNANGGGTHFTKPMDYIGDKTFTSSAGYAAYANQYIFNVNIPNCGVPGKVFVGQRQEGFVVNLGKIFDLVNFVPIDGTSFNGGIMQNAAYNALAGKNITSLALEVPTSCLAGKGNGVIGGWTTSSLPQAKLLNPQASFATPEVVGGAYTQMSRLGMPLVNELVIGLKDKDLFNSSQPSGDAQFLTYVTNPSLPELLNVLFKAAVNSGLGTNYSDIAPSNFPRNDLVATFLTGLQGVNQLATVTPSEELRLNTTITPTAAASQSTFGVVAGDLAGFPNGRRPGDDVVDVTLRVAMGRLCYPVNGSALGLCNTTDAPTGNQPYTDGAPTSATSFQTTFPYLNTPLSGSANYSTVNSGSPQSR